MNKSTMMIENMKMSDQVNPLEPGIFLTNYIQLSVHEILATTIRNEETYLQYFIVILKRSLEDIFPQYYIDSDLSSRLESPGTYWCVNRRESVFC